jgi:hypothetical protein
MGMRAISTAITRAASQWPATSVTGYSTWLGADARVLFRRQ